MRHRKFKGMRPSLRTAHDYLREGIFSIGPEDFLSDAEFDAHVCEIVDELEEVPRQFPRTQNLEFAILKAHLIIEHVLTQYIRYHARVSVKVDDIRLSFTQKVEIAYLMGFGTNRPATLPTIELLNRVRNQVAHRFTFDIRLIDELICINSDPHRPPPQSNRQRISALRSICAMISGFVAGQLSVEHQLSRPPAAPN